MSPAAFSYPVLMQRMNTSYVYKPPAAYSIVSLLPINTDVIEGDDISFQVDRTGNAGAPCSVDYSVVSSGGSADLIGAVTGTLNWGIDDIVSKVVTVQAASRTGIQGIRELLIVLSNAIGTEVNVAMTRGTISDFISPDELIITPASTSVIEGNNAVFNVSRRAADQTGRFTWSASTGEPADLTGPVTGTFDFAVGEFGPRTVTISTVNRTGIQGNRTLTVNGTLTVPATDVELPEIAAYKQAAEYFEGATLQVEVRRIGSLVGAVSATYTWTSSGTIANDLATPFTGTVNIPDGESSVMLSKNALTQSGTQGNRNITCTLSAPVNCTIKSSNASQIMTLKDATAPPTSLPKLQPAATLSDKSKWHCVGFTDSAAKAEYPAGRAGFLQAVQSTSYAPGDVIILADGTYTGADITITRSGTASATGENHLMIRARNHLQATIQFQLICTGAYIWITGLTLPFNKAWVDDANWGVQSDCVIIKNKGIWITNCNCTAIGLAFLYTTDATKPLSNIRICYNDITGGVPAAQGNTRAISVFEVKSGMAAPSDVDIAWNVWRNNTKPTGTEDMAARSFCWIHPSHPSSFAVAHQKSFRVHHNHISGYWRYAIYLKRSVYIGFNFYENKSDQPTNTYPSTLRHGILTPMVTTPAYGIGGQIEGEFYKCNKKMSIEANGFGLTINNCKKGGTAGLQLNLKAGTEPAPTDPHPVGIFDAVDYARVIEMEGCDTVIMGEIADSDDLISTDRGGWPDNVQLYKGDSNWVPGTITRDVDGNGAQCPTSAWTTIAGYPSGYTKVTAITEAELLAGAGCD